MGISQNKITITEEEFSYAQGVIRKLSGYFDAKVVGQVGQIS